MGSQTNPPFKPDVADPVAPSEERDGDKTFLNPPTFGWPGGTKREMVQKSPDLATTGTGDVE